MASTLYKSSAAHVYLNFILFLCRLPVCVCVCVQVWFTWTRTYVRWYIWVNNRPFDRSINYEWGGFFYVCLLSFAVRILLVKQITRLGPYTFKINSWFSWRLHERDIHFPLCDVMKCETLCNWINFVECNDPRKTGLFQMNWTQSKT